MPRPKTVLKRPLRAVSLHPLSLSELGDCHLPEGTWVEGARALLKKAEASGAPDVRIRVVHANGDVELKRVAVAELRRALESDGGAAG
jgi:hypothetical protein